MEDQGKIYQQEIKSKKEVPDLRNWAKSLIVLSEKMITNLKFPQNDNFALMALCFVSKQINHMKSILILNESRDVRLIARSMIEGMCQLLWAAKDPDPRSLRWCSFSYVHDWKLFQDMIRDGETVDSEKLKSIEEVLLKYGYQFLTPKAKKAIKNSKSIPKDPYMDSWSGLGVKEIFGKVKGEIVYKKLYKPFCDWHHWSPGGIGYAIIRNSNNVFFSNHSSSDAASALGTGFMCLLQSIEVLDKHLKTGMTDSITKLKNDYISWCEAHGYVLKISQITNQ